MGCIKFLREILSKDIKKYYFDKIDVDSDEYFQVVSNYIEYYHYRAWTCKGWFYGLNTVKLLALFSGVIMKLIKSEEDISVYMAASSAVCLAIEGVLALYHLQDKWILYRNTNNALMSEVRLFATSEGEYQEKEKRFSLFVEKVESIIGDEARKWNETVTEKNKKEKNQNNQNNEPGGGD